MCDICSWKSAYLLAKVFIHRKSIIIKRNVNAFNWINCWMNVPLWELIWTAIYQFTWRKTPRAHFREIVFICFAWCVKVASLQSFHTMILHTHTQTFIPKIYLKHKNRPNHLKKAFDCFFYASVRFCISFICILNLRSKQTALINSKWITTFSCDYFSWFRSEDNGWQRSDLKANQVNSNKWRNSNTLKSPEAP